MAEEVFVATVSVVIHPRSGVESQAEACDWFTGLLSENGEVLDWSYLKVGGQFTGPTRRIVDLQSYAEGDLFT